MTRADPQERMPRLRVIGGGLDAFSAVWPETLGGSACVCAADPRPYAF